jgi:MFS family permease
MTSIRSKTIVTRSSTLSSVSAPRLTALNFGIQTVWGAILAVSLQARCIELDPSDATQTYAWLAAGGAAAGTLLQIVAGISADRRRAIAGHRNEFYVAGAAIAIPALFWFFFAPSIALLAGALFVLQLGMNVASGPFSAAIPDYVAPERSGGAASWLAGYGSLGNAAGLLIAGFVTSPLGMAALLATALTVSLGVTLSQTRRLAPNPPAASARTRGPLAVLLLSRGAINVGFYIVLGFLLFFVGESLGVGIAGDQRSTTALLFLAFTLSAIAGAAIAAKPVDRYDKRWAVTISMAIMSVALIALSLAQNLTMAYLAAAVAGIAWGGFVTADWALACTILPQASMATSMSIWNIATAVPQVIAPLLAAPLVAYADGIFYGLGPRAAIALASVALLIGAALIWRLPARLVKRQPVTVPA